MRFRNCRPAQTTPSIGEVRKGFHVRKSFGGAGIPRPETGTSNVGDGETTIASLLRTEVVNINRTIHSRIWHGLSGSAASNVV
jgi:hypothetical protein